VFASIDVTKHHFRERDKLSNAKREKRDVHVPSLFRRTPLRCMKAPTLSDIAREAAVSRSAAARVLLGTGGDHVRVAASTRTRIEAVARRLRYAPNRQAQQLRGASSKTIGVILDSLNAPVMSQRLFALEAAASRRGYRLLIGQTHGQMDTLREYAADFMGRAVEAVLCLFDLAPGRDERARQCFGKFRKVVFHGRPAWPGGFCVRVDTEAALRDGVEHLIGRGKNRLALSLWNGASDELMALRQQVFEESMTRHKVRGVVWDAASDGSVPDPGVLDRGIAFMVGKCRADAILASNDIWATRLMLQMQKNGLRVPEDVAVVGYDNLDIASVISPSLTTVDQCHEDYAVAALELLLAVAAGIRLPAGQRIRTIAPRLVVREST